MDFIAKKTVTQKGKKKKKCAHLCVCLLLVFGYLKSGSPHSEGNLIYVPDCVLLLAYVGSL